MLGCKWRQFQIRIEQSSAKVWGDTPAESLCERSEVTIRDLAPPASPAPPARLPLSLAAIALSLGITGCFSQVFGEPTPKASDRSDYVSATTPTPPPSLPPSTIPPNVLSESWAAYQQRFIQGDGRVIDREAEDRSISEGQAYALLRAVLTDDAATFAKTLEWSENNLVRKTLGLGRDRLWAWKWGKKPDNQWGILDANFASDADIDAAVALILAARRWNQPEYLTLGKTKLQDLWEFSTIVPKGSNQRYLLPGPKEAFAAQPTTVYLNPSYLAPYAFRLFAQVDPDRDWLSLVDSSYEVLEESAKLSAKGLPSDWVALDVGSGNFTPVSNRSLSNLKTQYGFDAYRVWWRVALDAGWFGSNRAIDFLQNHLQYPIELWQSQQKILAEIDLQGNPLVDYEATSQYAMLYSGLVFVNPTVAQEIWARKIQSQYRQGFWDNDTAYYTQNLVWFGIFPATGIEPHLLKPQ
ncbi:MAG: glycosyl hydrolase [Cyanobacteria bacterium J055]|nr:MAG: glycosyl hydrolase [Cyanobacteria bacterium J055]